MKKVALVLPELLPVPPVKGGAVEHWIHEASKRMSSKDMELTIVSRPAGVPGWDGVKYQGVPWTPVSRRLNDMKGRLAHRNPLRALAKIQNVWSYGRKIQSAYGDADVVCIENDPGLLGFVRSRSGQRVLLHMHNDHLIIPALRPIYSQFLRKVDLVLCVSEYIRQQAVAAHPEHAHRFRVLMNATDPHYFRPLPKSEAKALLDIPEIVAAKGPIVAYVGRLTQDKGVHVLLQAFEKLLTSCPHAILVIAGSSFFGGAAVTPYQDSLRTQAERFRNNVVFTGFLPHDRVRYIYSAADVVAIPSVWQDPCPLVVLEAMSAGAAIVASRVGGIPEMLSNAESGLLIDAERPDQLREALYRLATDQKLAQGMGARARQAVLEKFNWDRLAREFEGALLERSIN